MSNDTAYPYSNTRPRATAGQRARAGSPMQKEGKHSLESLIDDIDDFIAEQEAYNRPARARSDSRGTMFVDINEEGEIVVSYRHPPPTLSKSTHGRGNDLPEGDLYIVGGGQDGGYAPRYLTAGDGGEFVRVAINAAGRGIYVQKMDGHRYDFEGEEQRMLQSQSHSNRRAPGRPKKQARTNRRPPISSLPSDCYAGGKKGEYPRPMRRVENKTLPRLPRTRRRRSFFEAVKEMVQKFSRDQKKGRMPRRAHQASWVREGYVV
ncbi:uncharacterized protein N0V89_008691 [Didymosphaeria variabile]|uniref:Uncharacterized protein n=1 Tax=Didymosphaeria variabile TaxID=1932322 RepID=A0A9W8XGE6_9PLEO|nr:uncharacterized protein N0V89_008691 [Didymosphaeria variabile]KAJ4350070.1 hypothetical protein N0V89_008691 [Didymosphaeria variabile]